MLKKRRRPDSPAITNKMASSAVEISAGDLDFFLNFLQTEGLEDFDFSVKEDEEDLVNCYCYFLEDKLRNSVKFCTYRL